MNKYYFYFIALLGMSLYSLHANAASCEAEGATVTSVFDMSEILVSDINKNKPGTNLGLAKTLNGGIVQSGVICKCTGTYDRLYATLVGPSKPITTTISGIPYYEVNDYISVGSSIYSAQTGTWFSVPNINVSNYPSGYPLSCDHTIHAFGGTHSFGQARIYLYIKKAFVGHIQIPPTVIASVYLGTEADGVVGSRAIVDYAVTGGITVPQNCNINAGNIIELNFGNVSSGAFRTAGRRAEGVNPLVRNIGIQCNNIAAKANLTLRLQADKVSGNAVVSDNKDVGFIVTDGSNRELTPNDINSVIPFILGDDARANVTIKAYPASITGNKPTEGVVTSLAYLRVDFA
ncbi:fimbrial-like adhesin [Serratia fonticola]|nr:fimbrial-like adhesin [Serratia fonticola]